MRRRLIQGINDLQTMSPELLSEWNYVKNGALKPNMVANTTKRKVWWICKEGHEWEASVGSRTRKNGGCGCPVCSNYTVLSGYNDLKTKFPLIAKEWDYDKNGDLKPNEVVFGSQRKVWWRCNLGHSWEASISTRTGKPKAGCPCCSNEKVWPGFNDLKTIHPELAKEWNYVKNKGLTPSNILYGSSHKVWWRCERGHEWFTNPASRVNKGTGCPDCKKESKTSFPEQAIFFYLRKTFSDIENGNRTILNGTELDIFIPSIMTAIEYDGYAFHKNPDRDIKKLNLCQRKGIRLFRIRENDCPVLTGYEDQIINVKDTSELCLEEAIRTICTKLSISVNINISRDRTEIYEQYITYKKENSLLNKYPEIAAEWNYSKNGRMSPDMVMPGSNKKVWWICSKGHEWPAVISSRIKCGCPVCAGQKVLTGYNDLQTIYPEIADEWNYDRNGDLKPSEIAKASPKKVWWLCPKGHEWQDTVANRTGKLKYGCHICSNRQVLAGYNDLKTMYPEIAKEWDYDKNGNLKPENIVYGSAQKVWWKCSKGHSWKTTVYHRTGGNTKCPYCANAKVLTGYNDLMTVFPEIAKEWNVEKNGVLKPDKVLYGSSRKVWWKCEKGHEWDATIHSRTGSQKCGCPVCTNVKLLPGYNDLQTKYSSFSLHITNFFN